MTVSLRLLRASDRGASVIEFALAAPIMATILLGMVEIGRAYSDRLFLEQAAQRTIERIGQQRTVSSNYSSLAGEAAAAAGVSSNQVTVHYWLECNGVKQTPQDDETTFAAGCPNDTDTYSRYVTVRLEKSFTPILSSKYLGVDRDGNYTLSAEAGIRVQ